MNDEKNIKNKKEKREKKKEKKRRKMKKMKKMKKKTWQLKKNFFLPWALKESPLGQEKDTQHKKRKKESLKGIAAWITRKKKRTYPTAPFGKHCQRRKGVIK